MTRASRLPRSRSTRSKTASTSAVIAHDGDRRAREELRLLEAAVEAAQVGAVSLVEHPTRDVDGGARGDQLERTATPRVAPVTMAVAPSSAPTLSSLRAVSNRYECAR